MTNDKSHLSLNPKPSTLLPPLNSLLPSLNCRIVDVGHARDLDLGIEIPPSDLQAVCSHEQWAEINARIVELINSHRSTLIFVNTRRLAERVTFQLTQMLGEDAVGSHHGSLSKEQRHRTEQLLKSGQLKAVVATSSLELGIDVGYIDLVIQLGSPRAIAAFLQRIGRSGHALGLTPKGRLFALTRDELVECMALIRAVRGGRLDITPIPDAPLDILAQQVVAELATEDWKADDLYACFRRAWPYRDLTRERFEDVLAMLADGLTQEGGRGRSLIYYDRINGTLKGRKGARIASLSNGGAIVELDSVRVILEEEHTVVGTVDEEFGVESGAGDIFLLGNTSWRIQGLRGNDLFVSDAKGAPPTIPFWRGEAPGRTIELSEEISRLREEVEARLIEAEASGGCQPPVSEDVNCQLSVVNCQSPTEDEREIGHWSLVNGHSSSEEIAMRDRDRDFPSLDPQPSSLPPPLNSPLSTLDSLSKWLQAETCCSAHAASQTVNYMAAQRAAIGLLPTQKRVVFERFFDESGGMQLVVHAPFGGRINRGWGLAFRKRFCRSFDFELQATADDDGFILSLGPQHSFPIETLFPMMRPDNARNLLEQALLVVPMFHLRWRWNVTRSLFVARMRNGKKVPPALQRFRSEDLLTAVFPKLTGCQENIVGDHEIPDHPLVQQTMHDCLYDALDLPGLIELLGRVESEEITFIGRDTREPSPFAYELLNANPYAFLDGGEAQERRARAVATRRSLNVENLRDLGRLDPQAIEGVVLEAQPEIRDADELHDLLVGRMLVPVARDDSSFGTVEHLALRPDQFTDYFEELKSAGRAVRVSINGDRAAWIAVENWPAVRAVYSEGVPDSASVPDTSSVRDAGSPGDPPPGPLPQQGGGEADAPPGPQSMFAPEWEFDLPASLDRTWNSNDALVALLRGWMETAGPVTAVELSQLLALPVSRFFACLEAIEGEGLVLRGRFRHAGDIPSDSPEIEWCHRRLLARIHRRTIAGLRSEIEAVEPAVFIEFAARHQGSLPGYRRQGADGVFEAVSQLQGVDIPAGAWESEVLPLRVDNYDPAWLDQLCLSGDVGWGRLDPPGKKNSSGRPMSSMTRSIPVSLFLRQDYPWLSPQREEEEANELSASAQQVLELLQRDKALFSSDIAQRLTMLPSQLSDVLGELAAAGRLTADGFGGLRTLIRSQAGEPRRDLPGRYQRVRQSSTGQGRWTLLPASGGREPPDFQTENCQSSIVNCQLPIEEQAAASPPLPSQRSPLDSPDEQWAWQLIRRWGVVFRDLAIREALAPPWWRLVRVYRRLEARGELRGGRFVSGVSGEQYALSAAIRELRTIRRGEHPRQMIVISAADPLNLTGVIGTGRRVPAIATHQVAYKSGKVAGWKKGEQVWASTTLSFEERGELERRWGSLTSGGCEPPVAGEENCQLSVVNCQSPTVDGQEIGQLSLVNGHLSSEKDASPPMTVDKSPIPNDQSPAQSRPPVVNIHTPVAKKRKRPPQRSGVPKPFPF